MDKDTFIMRTGYRNQFARLSMEERGELITAILDYENGLEPTFSSPLLDMAFSFIKDDLDYNADQYARKCERNRENGALGGRPRREESGRPIGFKKNQPVSEKPNGFNEKPKNPNDSDSDSDSEGDNDSEVIYTPKPPQGDLFERFWAAYPKKKSKGQARRAWDKLKPGSTMVDQMLLAIERAKQSEDWQKDGGQYIPYPATWLNAEGWEDEEPAPEPPPDRPPVKMHWVVPNPDSDNWEDLVP